jgi:hypothetical protein
VVLLLLSQGTVGASNLGMTHMGTGCPACWHLRGMRDILLAPKGERKDFNTEEKDRNGGGYMSDGVHEECAAGSDTY